MGVQDRLKGAVAAPNYQKIRKGQSRPNKEGDEQRGHGTQGEDDQQCAESRIAGARGAYEAASILFMHVQAVKVREKGGLRERSDADEEEAGAGY